ncbi:hypothetical protein DFR86_01865 [Acidianus sulfidivorans JP7]|uniref:Uncharacterized protein n=1 Tax=Acidianus sulfidivorans JP7 TaxID=619593 RepID=A0A2U9IKB4_9CREN|nr:hypothetical protein [Acidianus sulfidivorans]AWR96416.1 hypothetical protein DFR86_01865 [Acidianus sulfidivorans JP7]
MQKLVENKFMYFSDNSADFALKLNSGEKLVFRKEDEISLIVHKGVGELRVGKRKKIRIKERDLIINNEFSEKIIIAITAMVLFIHIEGLLT